MPLSNIISNVLHVTYPIVSDMSMLCLHKLSQFAIISSDRQRLAMPSLGTGTGEHRRKDVGPEGAPPCSLCHMMLEIALHVVSGFVC